MPKRGMFITFEGGEGSGKTTQMAILVEQAREVGFPVLALREPGGTLIGEAVRAILLDPAHVTLAPKAELLLYEAARAQLVNERILPALLEGTMVLCDRFYDSTMAYQGFARGLDRDEIRYLNRSATGGLTPDLTLYFDIDVAEGLNRATKSGADRMEAEDLDFHHAVRAGFLAIADEEPERVHVLDASGTIEEVSVRVLAEILQLPGR